MNFIKKNLAVLFFILYLVLPVLSLAQANVPPPVIGGGNTKIVNPINATTINGLIKTILEGVLKIGIPLVALAIIYSGFLFVIARGNSEELKKAKDALLYSVIGAAVLLGSWALAQLISDTVLQL